MDGPAPLPVYSNSDLVTDRRQNSPRLQYREVPRQPAAEWPTSSPRQAPRIDPGSQRMQNRIYQACPELNGPPVAQGRGAVLLVQVHLSIVLGHNVGMSVLTIVQEQHTETGWRILMLHVFLNPRIGQKPRVIWEFLNG